MKIFLKLQLAERKKHKKELEEEKVRLCVQLEKYDREIAKTDLEISDLEKRLEEEV